MHFPPLMYSTPPPHDPTPLCCRHDWPQWAAQDLARIFPTLEPNGVELLARMLEYDPAARISVSAVVQHHGLNVKISEVHT